MIVITIIIIIIQSYSRANLIAQWPIIKGKFFPA
jgi:hypothetical protein